MLTKLKLISKSTKNPNLARKKFVQSKVMVWNTNLPIKYLMVDSSYTLTSGPSVVVVKAANQSVSVSKLVYGSTVIICNKKTGKRGFPDLFEYSANVDYLHKSSRIYENKIVKIYTNLHLQSTNLGPVTTRSTNVQFPKVYRKDKQLEASKRGYLKHIVRLRYRWFFKPKLSKFKLFKKFFKRSLKRFRKINKNRLFVEKFRSHFSRLTGFKEKSMFQMWLPIRRNYNQYWSTTNAVARFSQSLILTPPSFMVFLRISPSLAASKHLVKSGAVSINGSSITNFTVFKPGDIMQLNVGVWRAARSFFSYQRWQADFRNLQQVPFLYVDWSSMLFFMLRWPHRHELVAPSFLSERWVRYYIRLFPVKTGKFKRAKNNLKIYKKVINKQ